MAAFSWIMLIGAIGTSTFYWLSRGRNEEFIVGRFKTAMAFCFWYVFIAYLIVRRVRAEAKQGEIDRAKKRILETGD